MNDLSWSPTGKGSEWLWQRNNCDDNNNCIDNEMITVATRKGHGSLRIRLTKEPQRKHKTGNVVWGMWLTHKHSFIETKHDTILVKEIECMSAIYTKFWHSSCNHSTAPFGYLAFLKSLELGKACINQIPMNVKHCFLHILMLYFCCFCCQLMPTVVVSWEPGETSYHCLSSGWWWRQWQCCCWWWWRWLQW